MENRRPSNIARIFLNRRLEKIIGYIRPLFDRKAAIFSLNFLKMNIAIGGDHAGFDFKNPIADRLREAGHEVDDFGTNSSLSVDYPDFAHPVAEAVESKNADFGIVICGSGNGVNMTVNKHAGIRGALCWTAEIARLARLHNDANVLAIPARFVSLETAFEMVDAFLATDFEGGRHAQRVEKIACEESFSSPF